MPSSPVVYTAAVTLRTRFGWLGVVASEDAVLRLSFGQRTQKSLHDLLQKNMARGLDFLSAADAPAWLRMLAARLQDYADGTPVDFLDVPVDTRGLTSFQRRVLSRCRQIPYGETMTYGRLARAVRSAGAARAVGSVMSRNRVPLIVPCHRVVASGGGLGGFSAIGGVDTKQRLLDMEAADPHTRGARRAYRSRRATSAP